MGLPETELARLLALDEHTARWGNGRDIQLTAEAMAAALQLVQICHALQSLVGHASPPGQAWISSINQGLGAVPGHLPKSQSGRAVLLNYLDRMRQGS